MSDRVFRVFSVVTGVLVAVTATLSVAAAQPAPVPYDGHTPTGAPCFTRSRTIDGIFYARELDCIPNGAATPTPAPAKPAQAQPPATAQSQPVQPVQAQPVTPVESQPVQPVQSQEIQPVQSQEIQPIQGQSLPAASNSCTPVDPSFFVHTYKTNVGGAAYTFDDLANDQRLLYTSPGAISGGLAIYDDGTYEWTTAHSGYMTGNWVVDPTSACGGITLLQADSGEDWTVVPSTTVGTIVVRDRFGIYFIGYALDS